MSDELAVTLHEIVYAMDSVADEVLRKNFGVDVGLFVFLTPLANTTMDITRLAESLHLTRAAVSKRVPVLERDGWLTTASDPNHGRRVLLSLTPKGAELIGAGTAILTRAFNTVVDAVNGNGEALNSQLQVILTAIQAVDLDTYYAAKLSGVKN
jgi:DNA-binding MarR family transcriptional regulator